MNVNRYRNAAVALLIIFPIVQVFLTLSELPLLSEQDRFFFATVRGFSIVLSLALAVWAWFNYASIWLNISVGIYLILYNLFGQWYRPLYYGSLMQLSVGYAFIFSPPKWVFRGVMVVWLSSYIFVFRLKWPQFQEQVQHLPFSDFVFMFVAVWIMAFVCHSYFTTDRTFREAALSRFSRMGFQSARLIHDLKGLTAAPQLYSELLKKDLPESSSVRVQGALAALSLDLENINKIVIELNQLSSIKTEVTSAEFDFSEIIQAVKTLLGNRLSRIEIRDHAKIKVRADKGVFTSIILNIVLNSLENFKTLKVSQPVITFTAEKKRIVISDNGGGFSEDVLKGLATKNFTSEKSSGSGMGLWMTLEGMESLGGKARFFNQAGGACVSLVFPGRCIVG